MTALNEPLEIICARYRWAREPLANAVRAFGEECVTKAALKLERQGTFARFDTYAVEMLAIVLAREVVLPDKPDEESLFAPKAARG